MNKKTLLIAIFALALFGCNDDKKQETTLLDSVKAVHDKIMADDGVIMNKKMQLKSIVAKDASKQDSVAAYTKILGDADDVMMNWMNKFNPVFSGKSHQQIMDYLHQQQAELLKINLTLDSAIKVSNNYISKTK
jgi:hypothetical protein